ncbi:hypothetical protein V1525DRAFT_387382 [Lipomyces kononenkoae]|uniref:Uncharacterized protein n=1 Tax=Lipomyces kononenkoae TaxID=34357 RepID=A0ACC3T3Z5_LIPKO
MSSSTSSLLGDHREPRSDRSVYFLAPWCKKHIRDFHESRLSHIIVITLVAMDTVLVVAELYVELFSCEEPEKYGGLRAALPAIRGLTLAIASIFMIELISTIYVFGLGYFFGKGKWLRLLDAVVIIGSFVFDILAQGTLSEGAELIVVLRFWRIAKIANEIGTETKEKMEELQDENGALRGRVMYLEHELATLGAEGQPIGQTRTNSAQNY